MIEFKNVHKWFGELHVLKGINLKVDPAEVLVVCGPSGSGKSTLIRCINRLEPIQKGELIVDQMKVHDSKTNTSSGRVESGPRSWDERKTYFLRLEWLAGTARFRIYDGNTDGAPLKIDVDIVQRHLQPAAPRDQHRDPKR